MSSTARLIASAALAVVLAGIAAPSAFAATAAGTVTAASPAIGWDGPPTTPGAIGWDAIGWDIAPATDQISGQG